MTPLMHASLLSGQLTTKEQLGIHTCTCICVIHVHAINYLFISESSRTKEPFWCWYGVTSVQMSFTSIEWLAKTTVRYNQTEIIACGWITDVHFGRCKVISLSIWIYNNEMHSYVNGVLWTIIAIGFGGFQADIIQFGVAMVVVGWCNVGCVAMVKQMLGFNNSYTAPPWAVWNLLPT